ncbi:preprotein translocase subunit SecA [Oscillospiraceae bacterium HV4-5-C5C]|nr:preprotein translocase subunit SecA [Oscillospiraceae bacterium HV4-5-C5C]
MGIFQKMFGTYSDREVKRLQPVVDAVFDLEEAYSSLSEQELQHKTVEFRDRLADGESLDDLLPEAFAAVREAAWRVLDMKHYRVQVIGGIVLHQGRIAEMKTGEGKTLVATLPVYLNALTGKGVHVITVNDYLAKRDSEWMGKIYRYLGLSVGLIVHGLNRQQRQQAYLCDIVYGTNNEFGFDYLRDNMVTYKTDLVQKDLNFAIVDEVDSILIDEARTPLIISGQGDESTEMYQKADNFVRLLKPYVIAEQDTKLEVADYAGDADYIVDEKAKSATLTEGGVAKAERYFRVENLADEENYELQHYINNAIKAHGVMHRDDQYVIKDGEIVIVDEFTGRLMFGRRYSDGLHQAIEAKEGVHVKRESKTLATITFQNYFRMYKKLSGMTGTAATEEDEFRTIYSLDVVSIPTNRPIVREDLPDAVYKTENGKYKALMKEVLAANEKGQPLLIGTVSVDKSEKLSQMFKRYNIRHNVLNAKHHEREAEIVAQAGRYGAVTIATNMAGRGTDILLGGNPEFLAKQEMRKLGYSEELIDEATAHNDTDDEVILEARQRFGTLETQLKQATQSDKEKVIAAGGLYIIGTERHESRRIDNQLRGRSGRQGDPGKSKFYLSLEDDLLRLFGGERLQHMFETLGVDEDMQLENRMLSNAIESAQKKVEGRNFSIRKNVLEYDDVLNQQREMIYSQRRQVLEGADLQEHYRKMISEVAERILLAYCASSDDPHDWDFIALINKLADVFGPLPIILELNEKKEDIGRNAKDILNDLSEQALARYAAREEELGSREFMREAERVILLRVVDQRWMDHIDAMDELRNSIGMRGYAQHDPVIEYKREGMSMFEEMNDNIQEGAVRLIMRARFMTNRPLKREEQVKSSYENDPAADEARQQAERRRAAMARMAVNARQGRSPVAIAARQERAKLQQQNKAAPGNTAGDQQEEQNAPVKRESMKVGRNDPCPCGSGKKYKNCHGKNAD